MGGEQVKALVVYREFESGEEEIGVLTYETHGFWVDVGDFKYFLSWGDNFHFSLYPFQIIGEL